jgi:aminopeptidase N
MYDITFHIPKSLTLAATGTRINERVEGGQSVSQWKSEVPLSVAGFNFGDFKSETAKLEKVGVQVTAFANREIPDSFKTILYSSRGYQSALGSLSTTPMLKKSLAEAALAVELYTDYFGPMPYKDLQVTQQTACNYGQAWPGLVFLPICYFLDTTQRHELGLDDLKSQYWKIVEPHEVAHEWWGHSIGWTGYRDQWMSEGFADFSASLFIQYVRNDRKEYVQYWKDLRDQLVEKDQFGHRPIDVGSVTMGYRVATSKVGGWTGQHVLYPKGAYILHMIRSLMHTPQKGDADFRAMMQDLVNTYRNQPVSTEDFQAMVEKHMTKTMDAADNHKMDWFFDEWVYGTEIPHYAADSTSETGKDGKPAITLKVTQSGVSPSFRMVVPVYFEMSDGRVGKLGQVLLVGNQTISQTIPFGTSVPKRLLINYNYDVLATN